MTMLPPNMGMFLGVCPRREIVQLQFIMQNTVSALWSQVRITALYGNDPELYASGYWGSRSLTR